MSISLLTLLHHVRISTSSYYAHQQREERCYTRQRTLPHRGGGSSWRLNPRVESNSTATIDGEAAMAEDATQETIVRPIGSRLSTRSALLLRRIRRHAAFVGPGVIATVAYIDPGNWATDLQAGSEVS